MTTAPICDTCTHFRGGIECAAFEQIPPEIFWNELAHTAPLDGDHGIQYDAVVEILDFGPLDPAVLDDWLNDPEFRELFDEELKAEKLAKGGEGWESVTRDEHGRWAEGAGQQAQVDPLRSAAARRAWDTIRANRAREAAAGKQQEPKVTQQDKDLAREFNERLKGGNKIELKPTATDKETPQFRTVKEAEAYAKTLGYKADLGKDITTAQHVVEGLAAVKNIGGSLPREVNVLSAKEMKSELGMDPETTVAVTATYKDGTAELIVNGGHPYYWQNPGPEQQKDFKDHWSSSGDKNQVLIHEAGHFAQAKEFGIEQFYAASKTGHVGDFTNKWEKGERSLIAQKVSQYGATEPMEMVAEVYAGSKTGITYDKSVMDLYAKYRGPKL